MKSAQTVVPMAMLLSAAQATQALTESNSAKPMDFLSQQKEQVLSQ